MNQFTTPQLVEVRERYRHAMGSSFTGCTCCSGGAVAKAKRCQTNRVNRKLKRLSELCKNEIWFRNIVGVHGIEFAERSFPAHARRRRLVAVLVGAL